MRVKKLHLDPLKRLSAKKTSAMALFRLLSSGNESTNAAASVDHLVGRLVAEQQTVVHRAELIRLLRALEVAGCGRFLAGRRGRPSRFAWKVSPASIAQTITGVAPKPPVNPVEATPPRDEKPVQKQAAPELLEHLYRLRRHLTIAVHLPPDLTPNEAQRLGDFMRTLSFG